MRPTLNDTRNAHDNARKERPIPDRDAEQARLIAFLRREIELEDWQLGRDADAVRAKYRRTIDILEEDLERRGKREAADV